MMVSKFGISVSRGWFSGGSVMMYGTEVIWYKLKPATVQRIFDTKTSDPHMKPTISVCLSVCRILCQNLPILCWQRISGNVGNQLLSWFQTISGLMNSYQHQIIEGTLEIKFHFALPTPTCFLLDMLHPHITKTSITLAKFWGGSFLSTWRAWPQLVK